MVGDDDSYAPVNKDENGQIATRKSERVTKRRKIVEESDSEQAEHELLTQPTPAKPKTVKSKPKSEIWAGKKAKSSPAQKKKELSEVSTKKEGVQTRRSTKPLAAPLKTAPKKQKKVNKRQVKAARKQRERKQEPKELESESESEPSPQPKKAAKKEIKTVEVEEAKKEEKAIENKEEKKSGGFDTQKFLSGLLSQQNGGGNPVIIIMNNQQ